MRKFKKKEAARTQAFFTGEDLVSMLLIQLNHISLLTDLNKELLEFYSGHISGQKEYLLLKEEHYKALRINSSTFKKSKQISSKNKVSKNLQKDLKCKLSILPSKKSKAKQNDLHN